METFYQSILMQIEFKQKLVIKRNLYVVPTEDFSLLHESQKKIKMLQKIIKNV